MTNTDSRVPDIRAALVWMSEVQAQHGSSVLRLDPFWLTVVSLVAIFRGTPCNSA